MGAEKAFLALEGSTGTTLIEQVLALARAVTPIVSLVGSPNKLSRFGPVIEDIYPDCGPLGGIHAALTASGTDLNLILAVDAPFVSEKFLGFLAQCAEDSGAVVTVPRTASGWQPLCGVYRRAFAETAREALGAGRNRIDSLFSTVSLRVIEEAEMRRLAFDPAMFHNLNTPEDWERARERTNSS
jgi:molybdopterin-guanine dinucleotide biosynthesis protein A